MSNTNETTQSTNRPSHVVKTRLGWGENARFIRLGVAYDRQDGKGLYVRLTGKQVIENGFYLFPIKDAQAGDAR